MTRGTDSQKKPQQNQNHNTNQKKTQPKTWEESLKNSELRDIICGYSKNDFCCKLTSSSAQYDLL